MYNMQTDKYQIKPADVENLDLKKKKKVGPGHALTAF